MRTVLCDVDGILADFIGGICLCIPWWQPERFTHFDMSPHMTPEEISFFNEAYNSPGFCVGLDWYKGAKGMLESVKLMARVVALTAPGPSNTWHAERIEWLRGSIHPKDIIFADSKHKPLIRGDILIEDRLETANDWSKANPDGVALLIDRPWNRGVVTGKVNRMNAYHEVVDFVERTR